ncbi:MAG TPA: tetratricopeptide repeat protein [Propionibacteriaceae bacterium]|nr:tetratricopeptide repeat protein [Propionibacteriaceae bacterium]
MSADRAAWAAELLAMFDPDAPEISRDRLLALAASTSDPAARAVALTGAARAAGLAGDEEHAAAWLDEASEQSADVEVGVRVVLERGRLLRTAGDPTAARECFERALTLCGDTLDVTPLGGLIIDALHMIAVTVEEPEGQVDLTRRALDLAAASADPFARRWRASLLNNLGCALVDAGRPGEALPAFTEALRLREAAGDRRATQVARWMVGWGLRLVGRTEEARAVQERLLEELHADGIDDVHVLRELALLAAGDSPGWHSG